MGLFATASLATAILSRAWLWAERITHKDSSDGAKPMKIIRRAVNTFSKPAGRNIFFNLDDRQQKILPEKTVLNHKSSGPSLKLLCR